MSWPLEPWLRSKFRKLFRAPRALTPQEQLCNEALAALEGQLTFSPSFERACEYRPGDTIKIKRPQRFVYRE